MNLKRTNHTKAAITAVGGYVPDTILSNEDLEKPSLRFSFSKYNNEQEIDNVVSVLKDFIDSN